MAPLDPLLTWLASRGLEIALIVLGSVLLARFVAWVGEKITDRIDARATGGDALVRSEAAKHRHSLTQVITWTLVVLIYTVAGFGAQRIVGDVLAGFFIITERQYGFGDVVSIQVVGGVEAAEGTIEDVTLRVTRLRSANGEVVTVPNGQIVKVVNLSRDWARAVIDVPVPSDADVNRVNEILREVGREAFRDPAMRVTPPPAADAPTSRLVREGEDA